MFSSQNILKQDTFAAYMQDSFYVRLYYENHLHIFVTNSLSFADRANIFWCCCELTASEGQTVKLKVGKRKEGDKWVKIF